MVYRKKRTYRRKSYGRRRNFKRKFTGRARYTKRGLKVYSFTRFTGGYGTLTISNVTPTLTAYNFSLADLPTYTEFTGLYDMYKINAVKITFIPQMNTSVSIGTVNNPNASARFFSAIDYNDAASPATIDDLREYKTCKWSPVLKTHKRFIYRPKVLDSSSYSMTPWIATSAPAVNYFGLKVGVEAMGSSTTASMVYTIEAKFYMTFKNVK